MNAFLDLRERLTRLLSVQSIGEQEGSRSVDVVAELAAKTIERHVREKRLLGIDPNIFPAGHHADGPNATAHWARVFHSIAIALSRSLPELPNAWAIGGVNVELPDPKFDGRYGVTVGIVDLPAATWRRRAEDYCAVLAFLEAEVGEGETDNTPLPPIQQEKPSEDVPPIKLPVPKKTYSISDLTTELGAGNTTLSKYEDIAGVAKPGRGKKNHRFSAEERQKILQAIADKGVAKLSERAKKLLATT